MPDAQHLVLFIAAGVLLNLTPGPDVLYIVSNAIRRGARVGVVAALGVSAGCFVHIFAAAVGVSALVAASATAFLVLKWVGAGYLVYAGVRLLLARPAADRWGFAGAPPPAYGGASPPAHEERNAGFWSVFRGGFLTNALNPKVAIFFLAFLPQFIAPATGHTALAFLALGVLFNVNTVVVNSGWAAAAAWVGRRQAVQRSLQWLDRIAGLMFVGFGLKLALADHPHP